MKSLRFYLILGLVTFFFVTAGVPAVARLAASPNDPTPIEIEQNGPAANLIDRGRRAYEAGEFSRAAEFWQTAAQTYRDRGDRIQYALSAAYLSLAYQDLGRWDEARDEIDLSLNVLEEISPQTAEVSLVMGMALNTKGRLLLDLGQATEALAAWQQAEAAYERADNELGRLGSLLNQTQALENLGQYQRAQLLLEDLATQFIELPDSALKAEALRNLGVTLQAIGNLDRSQAALEQSLAVARSIGATNEILATQFAFGNTARDGGDFALALSAYQQVADASKGILHLEALLNQLSLLVELERVRDASALLPAIREALDNVSVNRSSIYARVNFAKSLQALHALDSQVNPREIAELLSQAVRQARDLNDVRAESYGLGQLGALYENQTQWNDAQRLTEQALSLAQGIDSFDLVARWEWQLARVLVQQNQAAEAIDVYRHTIDVLQDLRKDLVAIDPDVQFSYRKSVEPVYREFVQLLLSEAENADSSREQLLLREARETLEALQLAELDNFFREACLDVRPVSIDEIDDRAAVIYSVMLDDRLDVILSISGEPLRLYQSFVSQAELEQNLDLLLQSLNPAYANEYRLQYSERVYDWVIRPAEEALQQNNIETLVFVLDGMLRNVPMSSLYDGQQYLVEKYNVALTQSLQLLETRSQTDRLTVIAGGLSEERQGFPAIPEVETEVNLISEETASAVLLNEGFTREALIQQLQKNNFEIVHLATHGQFSSNAEDTFLLTWDGRINVKDLDRVLQTSTYRRNYKPLDLLVLSACQSAAGDDRATLGLAGFALRSGARSTIATLWSVQDKPTSVLMVEFYRQLNRNPNISKAEALRQAQLDLLRNSDYNHPAFWSPFVLVGNWL
ncbi:MAG: CHAT domain-containing protein [Cyanobacteria bacterium SBC]|nr:CHAT domain-containing protein [Cyanobacteria bacterium SBC]